MKDEPLAVIRLALEGVNAPGRPEDADLVAVDLTLTAGEFLLVLGERGAGGHTLLSVAAGVGGISAGEVLLPRSGVLQILERAEIGSHMRLGDVGAGLAAEDGRFRELVRVFGVEDEMTKPAHAATASTLQRTLLAGALASSYSVLVLEEVLGAMDEAILPIALEALVTFREAGGAVLYGAYSRPPAPISFSRSLTMASGRLIDPAEAAGGG